jgi:hypothetical protein
MNKIAVLEETEGIPLSVCINDCQLDYGQSDRQLAPLCFHLGCAFADMRWGSQWQANAEEKAPVKIVSRAAGASTLADPSGDHPSAQN